jgi:hypothetical protein
MRGLIHLISGFVLLFAFDAKAFDFVVSDTNDTLKITSLRGAIIVANFIGGNNTIVLGQQPRHSHDHPPAWVYHLTIPGADEVASKSGDLDITRGKLTIISASTNVIIDATGLGDRIFTILPRASLTLKNLTLQGGVAPQGRSLLSNAESGGAIYNFGTLSLENCIITNNSSGYGSYVEGNGGGTGGGDAGGIYNLGTASLMHCFVVANSCGGGVDGGFGGNGGGIRNDGKCSLTNCIIDGNQAGPGAGPAGNAFGLGGSGGYGGGILNFGTMILKNCAVGGNFSGSGASGGDPNGSITIDSPGGPGGNGGSGAGIYNAGRLQLAFSTVYGNQAGNGGNGGSFGLGGRSGAGGGGGGIFNSGQLNLNTSTISSNFCGNGGDGGTGRVSGADGGAGGAGGGIYNSGFLNSTSCTVALNQTGAGGAGGDTVDGGAGSVNSGGQGGDGGGIWNDAGVTNAVIRNTLVAQNLVNIGGAGGSNIVSFTIGPEEQLIPVVGQIGNPSANGVGFDVAGDFTSQGFNLISAGDGGTGFTNGIDADEVGSNVSPIDPLLGPLQMNGGWTPSHALLPGSPAIDQGKCFGIHFDQRGFPRPVDLATIPNAPGGDGTDIGAFEVQLPD